MSDDSVGAGESEADVNTNQPETVSVSQGVLEVEYVYSALDHPRRRYLCYTLTEDTEWVLTELARKIAAWENDVAVAAVTDAQLRDVYVSLYHAHVPKLVDIGVITFDEATEVIRAGDHAEQVLTALEGIGGSLDSSQETHARGTNE